MSTETTPLDLQSRLDRINRQLNGWSFVNFDKKFTFFGCYNRYALEEMALAKLQGNELGALESELQGIVTQRQHNNSVPGNPGVTLQRVLESLETLLQKKGRREKQAWVENIVLIAGTVGGLEAAHYNNNLVAAFCFLAALVALIAKAWLSHNHGHSNEVADARTRLKCFIRPNQNPYEWRSPGGECWGETIAVSTPAPGSISK